MGNKSGVDQRTNSLSDFSVIFRYVEKDKKYVGINLTADHNPSDYTERMRIQKAGGQVRCVKTKNLASHYSMLISILYFMFLSYYGTQGWTCYGCSRSVTVAWGWAVQESRCHLHS